MTSLEESAKKLDFRGMMLTSIVTALSFVVGLFWRDAISDTINQIVPGGEGLFYKYLTAIIVTVIVVVIAYVLIKSQDIGQKIRKDLESEVNKKIQEMIKSKAYRNNHRKLIKKKRAKNSDI